MLTNKSWDLERNAILLAASERIHYFHSLYLELDKGNGVERNSEHQSELSLAISKLRLVSSN